MNLLNPFRKTLRTEALAPPPAPEPEPDPLAIAEFDLHLAEELCASLDREKRSWPQRREAANRRFETALNAYHAAKEQADSASVKAS
ncbi:MAG: hypothetical protein WA654_14080, partial [Candidatus Sulfotelmatobacter sp.]